MITFIAAAAFVVVAAIATLLLLDRVNLRAELAEAHCETADAQAAASRLESALHLSQIGSLSAAECTDAIERRAAFLEVDRDEWKYAYEDVRETLTQMRLRSLILPDLADPMERLVFDDGGESPIFDGLAGAA